MSNQSSLSLPAQVLGTVVLFLFAIQLLGSAVETLSPVLKRLLEQIIVGDRSALGVSWIASYVLANGSVVAALSLTLFRSELIVSSQLFLMVIGSRLGGAAIVLFIGAFDYLNEELESVSESVRLGLLTFLLTYSVYLPVLVIGYVLLPVVESWGVSNPVIAGEIGIADRLVPETDVNVPDLVPVFTEGIISAVGAVVAFLLALGLIFLSMRLFDRTLDGVDKQRLRERYVKRLNDKWTSFTIGLVFTGLTMSVAFSLGVIVPLYNRGHIKRHEIIPYVLGANIGTLVDTLIIAVALNIPVGVVTVALLLVLGFVISVLPLLFYDTYVTTISIVYDRILNNVIYFIIFLLSLAVVPVLLIVLR
ncbi:sodium:phosphate symporter [Haloterrigena sp. H1]|nr:sodium:phosphate symporter [Haloterrigena sp. H1]